MTMTALQKCRRKAGFTLIEMIVVIAIIAVLIALVAPLMTRYIASAKETRYRAAAKQLYTAAQAYIAEEMLNGCANCVDEDPPSEYNLLSKNGNGVLNNATAYGTIRLDEYLDGKVPGTQWSVIVEEFGVQGAVVMEGETQYAYPPDFDPYG
ncbi:type II secretion system protein [uncultured Anaerotruncus sp.]|uniref:type II secretion system protein n=1 Tax=uncultured Anaerotruncus sp. TaxID=905011 RepID=UPI00280A7300|nr:type II secretion system protein [uncultured Anaerotruncus sp.]